MEMVGFSIKINAKRVLEKNFKIDIDYKIFLLKTDEEDDSTKSIGLNPNKL